VPPPYPHHLPRAVRLDHVATAPIEPLPFAAAVPDVPQRGLPALGAAVAGIRTAISGVRERSARTLDQLAD
jgi:hypothetical protein